MDVTHMTPIGDLDRPEPPEDLSLAEMAEQAKTFLNSQSWCREVREGYLDIGWEGILALFLFKLEPVTHEADDTVWVIVGDVPPAYLDLESCPSNASALSTYVELMEVWIEAVRSGRPVDDLMPVYYQHSLTIVPPTIEFADMLSSRLDFIKRRILPNMQEKP